MTSQEHDILWNEYFYPGTSILVNHFNIKNNKKLKEIEATHTFERLLELRQVDLNMEINKDRLNKIHEYLFEDIYPFAGKYRKVNMIKERGTFLLIDTPKDIDDSLDKLFFEIDGMLKNCHNSDEFSSILAKLYTSLIHIHPYREGNGRTIREFLREFSIKKSDEIGIGKMELDWSAVARDELDECIEVVHLFPYSVSSVFLNALVLKKDAKNR